MSQCYTRCEVSINNGRDGKPLWLIIRGDVYDVTEYLSEHPGGEELLLQYGGKDASKAFNEAGHSCDAVNDMKKFKIGFVTEKSPPPLPSIKSKNDVSQSSKSKLFGSEQSISSTKTDKSHKKRIKFLFCL